MSLEPWHLRHTGQPDMLLRASTGSSDRSASTSSSASEAKAWVGKVEGEGVGDV